MSQPAVQINQIDLLSGISTVLVIVAGIVQIWPSPSQVYQKHLEDFMDWLKTNIEKDFCMSIYFCEKKCMTQLYDSSLDLIEKRIRMDIGEIKEVGCVGSCNISAKSLAEIAQRDNNGAVLVELAKAVRYPKIKKLNGAIRALGYSPSFGRRVIFFQWVAVIVAYLFNWLFIGVPNMLSAMFVTVHNILRRTIILGPMEPSSPHILKPEEQMAELARHQVISDHIPWVRYGIYYLVASLAGKQLSTRTWKIDETAAKEKDKDCTVIENGIVKSGFNEHVSAFNHVMINERRLTMKIAGDECSAARLLYSIALHSLQVILLCNTFGYPPPHKLIGSFIGAQHDLKETMILFRHAQLDSVFKHLYGWTLDRSSVADARGLLSRFDSLLQRLHSQLFIKIAEPGTTFIPINLVLMPNNARYFFERLKAQSDCKEYSTTFWIDDMEIGNELFQKLWDAHSKSASEIDDYVKMLSTSRVFWGVSTWLLYTLSRFYSIAMAIYEKFKEHQQKEDATPGGNIRLSLLINAPFQTAISRGIRILTNRYRYSNYCGTVPMWCVCSKDCRGICTLIINELEMGMAYYEYLHFPYAFNICQIVDSDREACDFDHEESKLKLLCASNLEQVERITSRCGLLQIIIPADFMHPERDNNCVDANAESGFKSTLVGMRNRRYNEYRSPRVSNVEYPLSDLLYEDALQLVVILEDQLLKITPGERRYGTNMELAYWDLKYNFDRIDEYSKYGYINREIRLKLLPADKTDQMSGDFDESNRFNQAHQSNDRNTLKRIAVFDPVVLAEMATDPKEVHDIEAFFLRQRDIRINGY